MTLDQTTAMDDMPVAKPSCHVREVGQERVVYTPEDHEVVFLNTTAAWLFELCDGTRTVQDMLAAMVARFEADEEVLRTDLLSTLAMFRSRGLV